MFNLSQKAGAIHWYGQRATALIIAPLILFLIFKFAILVGSHASFSDIFHQVKSEYSIVLLIVSGFLSWHGVIGMESIIDDYVQNETIRVASHRLSKLLGILTFTYLILLVI